MSKKATQPTLIESEVIEQPQVINEPAADYRPQNGSQETAVAAVDADTIGTHEIVLGTVEDYEGDPINRAEIVRFADTLAGIHPDYQALKMSGMRAIANLSYATGANPLPGQNGIHAWRDPKKGDALQLSLGIGYWRAAGEALGGILWIDRPRPMMDKEREYYQIAAGDLAAICKGARKREVFALIAEAKAAGYQMSLSEAKDEVARIGIGTVRSGEWAKNGRPPLWSAMKRAETDFYKQIVSELPNIRKDRITDIPITALITESNNHEAHDLLLASNPANLPENYSIADANADFFDDEPDPPAAVIAQDDPEEGDYFFDDDPDEIEALAQLAKMRAEK